MVLPLESLKNDTMALRQEPTVMGSNQDEMRVSLQAITQQLKTLHHQIHKHQRQFNGWENLEEMFTAGKAEENAAKKKCAYLLKEVRELSDKVQNYSTIEALYKETKASNVAMDLQRQTLQQTVGDLKNRLNIFYKVKEEYEAVRQEHEELQSEIRRKNSKMRLVWI